MASALLLVPPERLENTILLIRGQRVILDVDLAKLYGVQTRVLLQSVRRNIDRFPSDFAVQLTADESKSLTSQSVISKGRGGRRNAPYVFTEQGVAMLSSVLRSERAVSVNIEIMRAFVRLRQLMATHADLARKLDELEQKYDEQFRAVFDAIRELMREPKESKRKPIGYHTEDNERHANRKPAKRRG